MLKHEEGSLRFQDPFDLLHASRGVAHRAKHERYHHTVKGGIGERQGVDGSLGERYGHRRLTDTRTRIGEHGCIRFNRFHPLDSFCIVPGKVQPGPRSHLQDHSRRLSRRLLAQRIGETTLRTKMGIPLVEPCKARMKDLRGRFPLRYCRIMLMCHVLCSFRKRILTLFSFMSLHLPSGGITLSPSFHALVVVFRGAVPPRLLVLPGAYVSPVNQARSPAGKPWPNRNRICSAITSGPGSSSSNHQVMACIIMLMMRRASSTGSYVANCPWSLAAWSAGSMSSARPSS